MTLFFFNLFLFFDFFGLFVVFLLLLFLTFANTMVMRTPRQAPPDTSVVLGCDLTHTLE